jgi:cell pole-organizing protein PopZ
MTARPLVLSLLTALALTGAAGAPAIAQQPPQQPPARERPLPGRHIEGRIAFMQAELKITPAQQAHWERVAAAMRANAQQRDQTALQMRARRGQQSSAVERVERRAQMAELQAASAKTFAAAFKPLYESFSDDQKKSADELFERRGPGRGARRR